MKDPFELNKLMWDIANQAVAPLKGADADGVVVVVEGNKASVDFGSGGTPGFTIPPGMDVVAGDHVLCHRLDGYQVIRENLTRASFPAGEGGSGGEHPDLAEHDALGLATDAELDAHEAAVDPHPGYTTAAELSSAVTTHEGLADPHPGYTTAAELAAYAQPLDSDLTAFAGLGIAADKLPYGTGSHTLGLTDLTAAGRALLDDANAAAQIATLGLDADLATFAVPASTTISAFGASLVDDANAAAVLATLGLDADLATLSVPASTTVSAFGATLVDDANAAAAIATLGLDADLATLALPASTTISAFGATVVDDADAAAGRATLGAAPVAAKYIVQTADSELSAEQALGALATGVLKNTTTTGVLSIAAAGTDYVAPGGALGTPSSGTLTNATGLPLSGLTGGSNDDFAQRKAGAWTNRTPAQVLADLAAVGTTFQPLDTDLTTIAGLTATTDSFMQAKGSAWSARTIAQVLADLGYVESSGTLTATFGGGSTGMTISSAPYQATKFGRKVYLGFAITFTAKGSSTGTFALTGLPYTGQNTTATGGGAVEQYNNMTGVNGITIRVVPNTTTANFYFPAATTTTLLTHAHFTDTSTLSGFIVYNT